MKAAAYLTVLLLLFVFYLSILFNCFVFYYLYSIFLTYLTVLLFLLVFYLFKILRLRSSAYGLGC